MRLIKSTVLTLLVVGVCGLAGRSLCGITVAASFAQSQVQPKQKSFQVFDGTLYADKPDLSAYGIHSITMSYAGKFGADWHKDQQSLPDKQVVQNVAREVAEKAGHVVIDIEHWPLKGNPKEVQDSVSKYLTVLQWFKEAAPGLAVGFYGAPPLRDYWRAIRPPNSIEWQSYSHDNDRLRALAAAVDVFFPSLYTFYPDQGGWVRYAYANIAEARRYGNGKPVYVFLWPQYHDSNRKLVGTYLPTEYWRLELETAKQYADGVVIWGGWGSNNRPAKWDDNAGWWNVTKDFMRTVAE